MRLFSHIDPVPTMKAPASCLDGRRWQKVAKGINGGSLRRPTMQALTSILGGPRRQQVCKGARLWAGALRERMRFWPHTHTHGNI